MALAALELLRNSVRPGGLYALGPLSFSIVRGAGVRRIVEDGVATHHAVHECSIGVVGDGRIPGGRVIEKVRRAAASFVEGSPVIVDRAVFGIGHVRKDCEATRSAAEFGHAFIDKCSGVGGGIILEANLATFAGVLKTAEEGE